MTNKKHVRGASDEDPRPTVLFVVLAAGLGGSTRSVATVLAHLDPRRVKRVLATPPRGRFFNLVKERGLAEELVRLPLPDGSRFGRLARARAAWRVGSWLREHPAIAAVHVNGIAELNVVAPAARLYGVPVVIWSHSREVSPWMRRLGWVWPRVLSKIKFAAVSPFASQVLVEARLARAGEIEVIPNPIDPDDVVGVPDGHEGLVVGYLGSDATYKGFHLLPRIVEELEELPITWLVFSNQHAISDAEPWAKLARFPSDRVTVVGKLNDVRRAYARCDIILCPSLQESFCRVAAEAMLNGIPVVASDLEPIRRLLGNEEAGLFFRPGDVHGAADALRRLEGDAQLRESLGACGRRRADPFAPVAIAGQLASLYGVLAVPSSSRNEGVPISPEQR